MRVFYIAAPSMQELVDRLALVLSEHMHDDVSASPHLDPSVAPATGWPQPGGLTFQHVAAVITELSRTNRIVGGDVVELLPPRDVNRITALTVTRLLMLLAHGQAARGALTGR